MYKRQVESLTPDQLRLHLYKDYVGRTPGHLSELVYRTVADSATIEDAMTKGAVDVVWRGLNAAAITRFNEQVAVKQQTDSGYTQLRLAGVRVLQLEWSPTSRARRSKPLRTAIALALQGDRTSASLVPAGVVGYIPVFPQGGKTSPKVTWKNRINLSLGYDPTAPNAQDIAIQIRTRLENTGGLSVKLAPGEVGADLNLVDRKAWTATALAWLQPYLNAPLPEVADTVTTLETAFRRANLGAGADALLSALQKQSAADLTDLPLSQSDEYLYARAGVEVDQTSFGPGWQLGLWGITSG